MKKIALVVEDDPFVRDMAVRTLRAAGYRTTEAANGDEAYSLVRDLAPGMDLVFTDIVMPQMGGRELAVKLRRILPEIPVLFTSGYTEDTALGSSLDIKTGFLPKPFTPDILTRSVREILDRNDN